MWMWAVGLQFTELFIQWRATELSELLFNFGEHRVVLHLLFEAGVLHHNILHVAQGNLELTLKQLGGDEDVSLPRLLGSPHVGIQVSLQVEDNEVLQRVQLVLLSSREERQFVELLPVDSAGVDEVQQLGEIFQQHLDWLLLLDVLVQRQNLDIPVSSSLPQTIFKIISGKEEITRNPEVLL